MSRVLLDQNPPLGLCHILSGHEVAHTYTLVWHNITNGDLTAAAEVAGFEIMITADQNIRYQQNLAGRRFALIVLGTTHWDIIRAKAAAVLTAVEAAEPGGYVYIPFERPPRRRRS